MVWVLLLGFPVQATIDFGITVRKLLRVVGMEDMKCYRTTSTVENFLNILR